jgi:hypothetical protein
MCLLEITFPRLYEINVFDQVSFWLIETYETKHIWDFKFGFAEIICLAFSNMWLGYEIIMYGKWLITRRLCMQKICMITIQPSP